MIDDDGYARHGFGTIELWNGSCRKYEPWKKDYEVGRSVGQEPPKTFLFSHNHCCKNSLEGDLQEGEDRLKIPVLRIHNYCLIRGLKAIIFLLTAVQRDPRSSARALGISICITPSVGLIHIIRHSYTKRYTCFTSS